MMHLIIKGNLETVRICRFDNHEADGNDEQKMRYTMHQAVRARIERLFFRLRNLPVEMTREDNPNRLAFAT